MVCTNLTRGVSYNLDFPPFNSSITTDDVSYPAAWIFLMSVVVALFTVFTYSWHARSGRNLRNTEYASKYESEHKVDSPDYYREHPMYNVNYYTMWNPLLSAGFLIAWLIWAWVGYDANSCGFYSVPKDVIAFTDMMVFGVWVLCMYLLIVYDIYNKRSLFRAAANGNGDAQAQVGRLITLQGNTHFRGMHGTTSKNVRMAIYILTTIVLAGELFAKALIAALWDRSIEMSTYQYVPNEVIGLVASTGVLLSITWVVISLKNMNFHTYYDADNIGPVPGLVIKTDEHELNMHKAQVGLAADVVGSSVFLKGAIPFIYAPWNFIFAHVLYSWSAGFAIYNDRLQATAVFFVCGVVPLFLTFLAGNNIFYLTYSFTCTFFFFVFTYWLQGNLFVGDAPTDLNFDLMTLNQSATFPNNEPYLQYGTSILLVCSLSLILAIYAFLRAVTDYNLKTATGGDDGTETPDPMDKRVLTRTSAESERLIEQSHDERIRARRPTGGQYGQ